MSGLVAEAMQRQGELYGKLKAGDPPPPLVPPPSRALLLLPDVSRAPPRRPPPSPARPPAPGPARGRSALVRGLRRRRLGRARLAALGAGSGRARSPSS